MYIIYHRVAFHINVMLHNIIRITSRDKYNYTCYDVITILLVFLNTGGY